MSDFINNSFDLLTRYTDAASSTSSAYTSRREEDTASSELSFTDMLQLMVVQFQNQSIDSQADTTDMMNQLVQMSVVQAMTDMTEQIEQLATLNTMSYSASLVGKEVTVGVYDDKGTLQEIVGTVTASGTYDGEPVIFLGNTSYLLSSVMAVGRLPAAVDDSVDVEDPTEPEDDRIVDESPDVSTETDTTVDSGEVDAAVAAAALRNVTT